MTQPRSRGDLGGSLGGPEKSTILIMCYYGPRGLTNRPGHSETVEMAPKTANKGPGDPKMAEHHQKQGFKFGKTPLLMIFGPYLGFSGSGTPKFGVLIEKSTGWAFFLPPGTSKGPQHIKRTKKKKEKKSSVRPVRPSRGDPKNHQQ